MASFFSLCLREQIRLIKPITDKLSIPAARTAQDALGKLGAKIAAGKVRVLRRDLTRCQAALVRANSPDTSSQVLLYLHGGGYVAGNLDYALGFGSILSGKLGCDVFCAAYRLAPEHPFPAAVEDALEAYVSLLDLGYPPDRIGLVGESAGGGLVFSLCLLLKERKLPLPKAVVAISPWTDLTFSGESYTLNRKKDPSLNFGQLQRFASLYGGSRVGDPLVSPLFGELSGMPRSLIIAGSQEMLLDDAREMARRLKSYGNRCELLIEEGLWHVYVLYGIPEAATALEKIVELLEADEDGESAKQEG